MNKLCKDCKHHEIGWFLFFPTYEFSKCKHPLCMNPVNGKGGSYCSAERKYSCIQAKYWESK